MRGVNGTRAASRLAGAVLACASLLTACGSPGGQTTATGGKSLPPVNLKGVQPDERASAMHLGRGDCEALGAALARRTGRSIRASSQPRPPHSECRLTGRGVEVTISLDASYGAHQRYLNRVVETEQFGAPDQAKMPHPVPGVGEPGAYGQSANWIPALGTMLAVRGNRWITVNYAAAGRSRSARKAAAGAVARQAFRLSAK